MSKLSLEIRFALALSASVAAIESCVQGVLADNDTSNTNLEVQFDWSTVDAHIEIAYIAKAMYAKEITADIGYLRAGRSIGVNSLSEDQVMKSAARQIEAFRTAIELGKKTGIITENDLLAVFRGIAHGYDLYLTTRTVISFLPSIVRRVLDGQRCDTESSTSDMDVKTMTTLFLGAMIYGPKPLYTALATDDGSGRGAVLV